MGDVIGTNMTKCGISGTCLQKSLRVAGFRILANKQCQIYGLLINLECSNNPGHTVYMAGNFDCGSGFLVGNQAH